MATKLNLGRLAMWSISRSAQYCAELSAELLGRSFRPS
nr:MAG TPA: hypothetical protein [Caudoviricetes sp.]